MTSLQNLKNQILSFEKQTNTKNVMGRRMYNRLRSIHLEGGARKRKRPPSSSKKRKGLFYDLKKHKFRMSLTLKDVIDDFLKLKELKVNVLQSPWVPKYFQTPIPKPLGCSDMKRAGINASRYFHWKDKIRSRNKIHRSAYTIMKECRQDNYKRIRKDIKKRSTYFPHTNMETNFLKWVRYNSSLMTLNNHRPSCTKLLCQILQPDSVLDFSAGWGDRLLGFLASPSVKKVTLVDPRKSACSNYLKQFRALKPYFGRKVKLNVVNGKAEFSLFRIKRKVDFIFTSPPYMNLEHYYDSSKQKHVVGSSESQVYLDAFLFPALNASIKLLNDHGVLALNINDPKDTSVCKHVLDFMARNKTVFLVGTFGYRMPKFRTHHNQVRKTRKSNTLAEPVYVWVKGNATVAKKVRSMFKKNTLRKL